MDESAFTVAFCDFVRECVPNPQAAAVLVFLVSHTGRPWDAGEILNELHSTTWIDRAEIEKCLELSVAHELVTRDGKGGARFEPRGYLRETHARTLAQAYQERPVTLVQLIYALRDDNIRSFADAFRIRGS
jgi:hypothetical protein